MFCGMGVSDANSLKAMEQKNVRLKKLLAETMLNKEALDQLAYEHNVQLWLIQPAKPTHNAYIESFDGKFRDGCLNEHWFHSLAHARRIIQAWRKNYND
jgi:putative transposase